MATIAQRELFTWEEIEKLGDLERLRLVLDYMPDEALMVLLEAERGLGRDDYPVRAVCPHISKMPKSRCLTGRFGNYAAY